MRGRSGGWIGSLGSQKEGGLRVWGKRKGEERGWGGEGGERLAEVHDVSLLLVLPLVEFVEQCANERCKLLSQSLAVLGHVSHQRLHVARFAPCDTAAMIIQYNDHLLPTLGNAQAKTVL
jgi:hypothetical protein